MAVSTSEADDLQYEQIRQRRIKARMSVTPLNLDTVKQEEEEEIEIIKPVKTGRKSIKEIAAKLFKTPREPKKTETPETPTELKHFNLEVWEAAKKGETKTLLHLLKNASKSFDINWQNKLAGKTTALHMATLGNHIETMKLLINYGADINATDGIQRTPLFVSCAQGYRDAMILLLGNKAKVNIRDLYGYSPLFQCLRNHNFELVNDLLLFGADINFKKLDGTTVVHESMVAGDFKMLQFLLNSVDDQVLLNPRDLVGETPLFKGIACAGIDCIELLLSKSVDLNIITKRGYNIFHHCAEHKRADVLKLLRSKKIPNQIISMINQGEPSKKYTPLHIAVEGKDIETAEQILLFTPNVNLQDAQGNTPLHIAILEQDEKMEALLRSHGARDDIKNNEKLTAKKLNKQIKDSIQKYKKWNRFSIV